MLCWISKETKFIRLNRYFFLSLPPKILKTKAYEENKDDELKI